MKLSVLMANVFKERSYVVEKTSAQMSPIKIFLRGNAKTIPVKIKGYSSVWIAFV